MNRLQIGERVQLHPATDHWMRGDRYAEVLGFTRMANVRVRLERSGRTAIVHPDNLTPVRDVQLRLAVERGLRACAGCCLDNEEELARVLLSVMSELERCGIRDRDTLRPPPGPGSDTERPPAP